MLAIQFLWELSSRLVNGCVLAVSGWGGWSLLLSKGAQLAGFSDLTNIFFDVETKSSFLKDADWDQDYAGVLVCGAKE